MAKILILIGVVFIVIGIVWLYFPQALSWFGRLPGDIRITGDRGGFYFPIISLLIISLVFTVLINLLHR